MTGAVLSRAAPFCWLLRRDRKTHPAMRQTRQAAARAAAILSVLSALTATAGLLLGAPRPARAWNAVGHMVIGTIAEQQLNKTARANVDRLLQIGATRKTRTFAEAGCWLDDVRAQGVGYFDRWHYHEHSFSPDNTPFPKQPHADNVVWAINTSLKALESKYISPEEQARALRVLIHAVEDVHQPLHCGSRYTRDLPQGDRGGNGFRLVRAGKFRSLHGYWDAAGGLFALPDERPLPAGGSVPITAIAKSIAAAYPPNALAAERAETNPDKWLGEGHALLTTVVYPASATPDEAYQIHAREIAKKRAAIAGYRLADLLNRLWPDSAAAPGAAAATTPPAAGAPSPDVEVDRG